MKRYINNSKCFLVIFLLTILISSCDNNSSTPNVSFRVPGVPENAKVVELVDGIKLTWEAPKSDIEVNKYVIERALYQGKELVFVIIDDNFIDVKLEFSELYPTDIAGDAYIYRIYSSTDDVMSAPATLNAVIRNEYFSITNQAHQVIKPVKSELTSNFGTTIALSDNGQSLAVVKNVRLQNTTNATYGESSSVQIYNHDSFGVWNTKPVVNLFTVDEVVIGIFTNSLVFSPDGKTLAVAVSHDFRENANGSASVYLFNMKSDGVWNTDPTIIFGTQSSEAVDFFGSVLAFSSDGKSLAVGDRSTGIAYLYTTTNSGNWAKTPTTVLKSRSASSELRYGFSLKFSPDNNSMAMGDTDDINDLGVKVGSVQIFTKSLLGQWSNSPTTILKSKKPGSGFGYSIEFSHDGNSIVVSESFGSLVHGYDKIQSTGNVQLFTRNAIEGWNPIPENVFISRGNFKKFGFLMTFNAKDDQLFISENDTSIHFNGKRKHTAGTVQLFKKDNTGKWSSTPQAILASATPVSSKWFGISMAFSSVTNTLAIGEFTKAVNIFDTALLNGVPE